MRETTNATAYQSTQTSTPAAAASVRERAFTPRRLSCALRDAIRHLPVGARSGSAAMSAGPAHGGFQEHIALVIVDDRDLDRGIVGDGRVRSPGSNSSVHHREDKGKDDQHAGSSHARHARGLPKKQRGDRGSEAGQHFHCCGYCPLVAPASRGSFARSTPTSSGPSEPAPKCQCCGLVAEHPSRLPRSRISWASRHPATISSFARVCARPS